MTRRTLEVVELRFNKDFTNFVIDATRGDYDLVTVIGEYVQNSVDSALELKKEAGSDAFPYPVEITISLDGKSGDVSVLDNCKGMRIDELRALAQNIFASKKRGVKIGGMRTKRGHGFQKYRSFFDRCTVKTKTKGSKLLEMLFRRGGEYVYNNPIVQLTGDEDDFPYPTGTRITLSGFKPGEPPLDKEELRESLEFRFDPLLQDQDFNIYVSADGTKHRVGNPSETVHRRVKYLRLQKGEEAD